jgi:hypothetical protein
MALRKIELDFASPLRRGCLLLLAIAAMFVLFSCGGTRVYTGDKTVIYRGSIYNVSDVRVYTTFNQAVLGDQKTLDLKGMDKRRFNELLEQHETLSVRQGFRLDESELLYQTGTVDSWADLSRMNKRFDSATKTMTRFIGDSKKTQLQLK